MTFEELSDFIKKRLTVLVFSKRADAGSDIRRETSTCRVVQVVVDCFIKSERRGSIHLEYGRGRHETCLAGPGRMPCG